MARPLYLAFGVAIVASACSAQAPAIVGSSPQTFTLAQAIQQAERNEPMLAAARADQKSAQIDAYIAKAGLLPSVTYHNQMLYTQPNGQTNQGGQVGTQAAPIFIANNAVHEYSSQAVIDENVGFKQFAEVSVAKANAARAAAELEVSRRGVISTVVTSYYTVATTEQKVKLQEQALAEAQDFTDRTKKREALREAAHADVIKALLQQQAKQRDLNDARVAAEKARLELGVLLFADPRTPYATEPAPAAPPVLATPEEINALAAKNNPEIRSALAGMDAANAGVKSARAGYLPDLGLNFTYGIDAPQFARNGPDGVRNLGYSISGTLDIPVWDWFATQKKIEQSKVKVDAAKVTLTAAQRKLIAALAENYTEAAAARDQLTLLSESVTTADESLRLTKLRYDAGESTALEVVDAQNEDLAAHIAQADGVIRYQTALAELQVLTGSL